MANLQSNSGDPKVNYEYRRKKSADEMRMQVITFTLMIFFTVLAFAAVGAGFSKWFIIPFVLLLACVQVAFQLYYFMHMSHKGHEAPQLFMWSGIFVAFLTILTFLTIIWW
ncbi:cytochrome c oxidase subunit IVB [Domibacillus epiphyticus]|uniref:Cytochrome c oxidase subunit IVB n=1 Tax=Domibacillus epiphyticus TaxID=1714355 RepID=A0A1V2AC07_9BACI|nr:cytochrome c oxidase subunit IVB [Domibacillus epiphyticus]OMP68497.1 cytochrome c oxidase subunit IVB [Domibacillus epiphyticus]